MAFPALAKEEAGKPAKGKKVIELTLGHTGNAGSIHDRTASEFAKRVNEALKGKVVVTVVGDSKLGNEAQMLEKTKSGEIAFSLPAPTLVKVDPAFAVFEMPYLVLSRDHVRKARADLISKYFEPAAEKNGLHLLALWENGFRHITNNVRPITTPADLKDVKLRVSQGSRLKNVFNSYGAKAEEFPFGQPLIDAIKAGKFDGQENPVGNIYTAKLHEVQKYLSFTGHQYGPLYLVSGKESWNKLPKSAQKTISKIAVELQDWSMKEGEKLEKEYTEKLRETMQVNKIDSISFLIASFPIYQAYAKEVPEGKALIRLLHDRTSFASAGSTW